MRSQIKTLSAMLPPLLALLLLSCSTTLQPTRFSNPRFDFSYLERVAVLPFENLSQDRQAGFRATRFMITELLASGAVEVVEPGEVMAAISEVVTTRATTPSAEEVIALGRELEVQGIVIGSVGQSEILRVGGAGQPVVTLDANMLETETGAIVWAATHTEKGSSFGARVLGTTGEPIAETTRRCVRGLLETLVE